MQHAVCSTFFTKTKIKLQFVFFFFVITILLKSKNNIRIRGGRCTALVGPPKQSRNAHRNSIESCNHKHLAASMVNRTVQISMNRRQWHSNHHPTIISTKVVTIQSLPIIIHCSPSITRLVRYFPSIQHRQFHSPIWQASKIL